MQPLSSTTESAAYPWIDLPVGSVFYALTHDIYQLINDIKPLITNIDDNVDKTVNRLDLIYADMVGEVTFLTTMETFEGQLTALNVTNADIAANTLAALGLLGSISNTESSIKTDVADIRTKTTSIDNKLSITNSKLDDISTDTTITNTLLNQIYTSVNQLNTYAQTTNVLLATINDNLIISNGLLTTTNAKLTSIDDKTSVAITVSEQIRGYAYQIVNNTNPLQNSLVNANLTLNGISNTLTIIETATNTIQVMLDIYGIDQLGECIKNLNDALRVGGAFDVGPSKLRVTVV